MATFLIKCNSAAAAAAGGGGIPQAALIAHVYSPAFLQGHDLLKNMDQAYKLIWQKCFDLGWGKGGGGAASMHSLWTSAATLSGPRLPHTQFPSLRVLRLHVVRPFFCFSQLTDFI